MKVHIIYLDPQDSRSSARDKLSWAQAGHVILVWPKHGRILTSHLDLVILQRHARSIGSHIGLVTHDLEVRSHAQELGIPVFRSLSQLPDEAWREPALMEITQHPLRRGMVRRAARLGEALSQTKSQYAPPSTFSRWALFAFGVLSVLVLAIVVAPSAEVIVQPQTEPREATVLLTLDPGQGMPPSVGMLPVRKVEVRMLGELTRPTGGDVPVPVEFASGDVVFTNLTSGPVSIPSGLGLRSSEDPDVRFETIEAVQIPASVGATTRAKVRALVPGPSGNQEAGSISAIDGLIGLEVRVTNPEPTQGGSDEMRAGVSQEDQVAAYEELEAQLLERAATALEASLVPGEELAAGSLVVSQIFARRYDHLIGEASETLTITLDMEMVGLVFLTTELEDAVLPVLEPTYPTGQSMVPGSLDLHFPPELIWDADGGATVEILAKFVTFERFNLDSVSAALLGKPPQEAIAFLEQHHNLEVLRMQLLPAWMPFLPVFQPRIELHWAWETF